MSDFILTYLSYVINVLNLAVAWLLIVTAKNLIRASAELRKIVDDLTRGRNDAD